MGSALMWSAPRLPAALLIATLGCGAEEDRACGGVGTICTVAGTGDPAFDGDGRPAAETGLYWPVDVEHSPTGEAFILDWQNHRVRRVRREGATERVETIIGTDFLGDGPPGQTDRTPDGALGTTVELNHPTDAVFLPNGTLVLAAWHNHKIRTWDPATGRVHVICGSDPGSAGDEGPAARARLAQPKSVTLAPDGAVYVTDSRNQRIRRLERVTPEARITAIAGTGRIGAGGDGGPPLGADLNMQEQNENPEPGGSITVDAEGRLYLADTFNHRVRRFDLAAGTVTTVAGTGSPGASGDGGPATAASLRAPRDLEFGPGGRLYIADTDNHRVRAVDFTTGVITTVAGSGHKGFSGDGGPATTARLDRPFGIGFDTRGDLFIADTRNNRIRKVVLR
jgi:sugar lactone lactonase YvrE